MGQEKELVNAAAYQSLQVKTHEKTEFQAPAYGSRLEAFAARWSQKESQVDPGFSGQENQVNLRPMNQKP